MKAEAAGPPLLLMIDDDRSFIEVASLLLTDHGYRVVTAQRGLGALPLLASGAIDLSIIDVHLPDIDGIDLVRRAHRLRRDIGLIIMTSSDDRPQVRQRCLEVGADRFMPKPLAPGELLLVLRQLLDKPRRGVHPSGDYRESGDSGRSRKARGAGAIDVPGTSDPHGGAAGRTRWS